MANSLVLFADRACRRWASGQWAPYKKLRSAQGLSEAFKSCACWRWASGQWDPYKKLRSAQGRSETFKSCPGIWAVPCWVVAMLLHEVSHNMYGRMFTHLGLPPRLALRDLHTCLPLYKSGFSEICLHSLSICSQKTISFMLVFV